MDVSNPLENRERITKIIQKCNYSSKIQKAIFSFKGTHAIVLLSLYVVCRSRQADLNCFFRHKNHD